MTHPSQTRSVVILAAGDGTRMRSATPKVLHQLAGRPMLTRIIDVAQHVSTAPICIVVAPHTLATTQSICGNQHVYVAQHERRGTGHALLQALPAVDADSGDVIVLFGDTPLIQPSTIRALLADKDAHNAALSILSFAVPAPHQYGRIVRDDADQVTAIVESKNCTPAQALISEANSGIMVLSLAWARNALPRVTPNPLTNEYYLTALVAMAVAEFGVGSVRALRATDPNDAWGVNDRSQLASAETMLLARTCTALMANGVTIPHPQQVAIAPEVRIGADTIVLPGSVVMGQTVIGGDCIIGPHTSIDDSTIGEGCQVPHSVVKHSTIRANTRIAPFSTLVGDHRPEYHKKEEA